MFNSLVILFEKNNEQIICRDHLAELQTLKAELSVYKVEVIWLFVEANSDDVVQQISDFARIQSIDYEESLYIADCPQHLDVLKLWGYYVIALLHGKNQGTLFKNASYLIEGLEGLDYTYLNQVYRRFAGLPWDILETARLKVRESTVEDVEEFYRIYKDPSITYYMDGLFEKPDMERAYMKNYIRRVYDFYGYGLWTVILKETGQVIGRAGLSVRDGYELPELGFVIEVACQRKGYAKEVCEAILVYAQEKLQMEGVQALVCTDNKTSVILLKKMGFVYREDVIEDGKDYQLWVRMFPGA